MSQPRPFPSVAEIRPVAQGAKTEADRRWTYRIFRSVSIYITWALLHTRVTPNQVTVISLVVAGIGLVVVAMPGALVAVSGCALLLVYHLLDRVDGELARYRKSHSLLGVYLDNAGHYLTGGGLLIAATYRLAPLSAEPQLLWLIGSLGAMATIMSRVEKHSPFHLFSQYVLERPDLARTVRSGAGPFTREAARTARSSSPAIAGTKGLATLVRDSILTTTSFPVTTALVMAGFFVESMADSADAAILVLIVVAALQVVAYAGVEVANLAGNLGSESRRLADVAGLSSDDAAS